MSRAIILCADDFGLTPGVDEAILDLATKGRLSAVSCMATAPAWRADSRRLRSLGVGIEIGIHLTFTELAPLGCPSSLAPGGKPRSHGGLFAAIMLGRVRREDVRREIARQIECFADGIGRLPDYVDGHHHAHQFPMIDALVVEAIAGRGRNWHPWLRVCADALARIRARGAALLQASSASLLGHRLRRKARALGIPTNDGISGFYDVRKAESYAALFPSFLRAMGPRHLIVCHPGHCADDAERRRAWMRCREYEYAFLADDAAFAALCAREDVKVATFAEIAAMPR